MTFIKEQLPDERLVKILSETQATINEHNRRQVRGSVEVDARLFEAVLIEAQLHRVGSNRLGIAAAAKWLDQQREEFDNEHGQYDPDTGTFEFGNDAQGEYSATLAELAEGILSLHPSPIPEPLTDAERSELQEYRNDAEPVYQWREASEEGARWDDCTKEQYAGFCIDQGCESRVLYTAPQPLTTSERAQLESARLHIAELEAAPPAPVGDGETPVPLMLDIPGRTLTQRECYRAGLEAGKALQRSGWSDA